MLHRHNQGIRKKKVYAKFRLTNRKTILRQYKKTSQIILEGNYLMAAGFRPDEQITVHVSYNRIVIIKMQDLTNGI